MIDRQDHAPPNSSHQETGSTVPTRETVEVRIRTRPLVFALALGVVLVITAGLLGQLWPGFPYPQFAAGTFLNGEYNIPSAYNAALFLLASVLLWLIGRVARGQGDPFARIWTGLAALTLFLTLDEYFALHDKINAPARELFGLGGVLYYAWVIPYGLLVLAVAVLLVRFLRRLPGTTRRGLLLAGGLYVAGALGLELFQARIDALAAANETGLDASSRTTLMLLIGAEELLEMSALVLLIAVLLGHLRRTAPGLALRLRLGGPGE